MRRWKTRGLWLLAVLAAGACDGGTEPRAPLDAADAQHLISGFYHEVELAMAGLEPVAGAFEFDVACTAGGRLRGSGQRSSTVDAQGTGSVTVSMQFTPVGCVLDMPRFARIAVNAEPGIQYDWNAVYRSGALQGSVAYRASGAISWTGRNSGSCDVEYTLATSELGTGSYSGRVCGRPVSGLLDRGEVP